MKRLYLFLMFYLILLGNADASFVSGSSGADGAFNPTANTVLQLPPDGIFNFTTVNIPSGVTVTFTKNAANTPVYILATGDVTIAGTINVDAGSASSSVPGVSGPGGYNGGYGGTTGLNGGKGLGPGGGGSPTGWPLSAGGGGFGTSGNSGGGAGGSIYGSARIVPLIGGSGGGGSQWRGGGGGGGAILIASSGSITVTGSITANGGNGIDEYLCEYNSGGGSGGAIRLIANNISGNGYVGAIGGQSCSRNGLRGGQGRIRIEAYTNNIPFSDPPYSYGLPTSVFVANTPILSITSIAGTNVPASPTGSYSQPDMMLPSTTTNPVAVNVFAANIPIGTSVKVRAIPQYGSENTAISTLSGSSSSSTATVNVNLSTTYSNVVTAESTFTIVGMYYDGEEIDKVRVAATMGGRSETVYITKSGKEIKGEMLAALIK